MKQWNYLIAEKNRKDKEERRTYPLKWCDKNNNDEDISQYNENI